MISPKLYDVLVGIALGNLIATPILLYLFVKEIKENIALSRKLSKLKNDFDDFCYKYRIDPKPKAKIYLINKNADEKSR